MTWNLILQMNHPPGIPTGGRNVCRLETVAGLAVPAHVHLVACHSTAGASAVRLFAEIARLVGLPAFQTVSPNVADRARPDVGSTVWIAKPGANRLADTCWCC
jgi:hypothetical protein